MKWVLCSIIVTDSYKYNVFLLACSQPQKKEMPNLRSGTTEYYARPGLQGLPMLRRQAK